MVFVVGQRLLFLGADLCWPAFHHNLCAAQAVHTASRHRHRPSLTCILFEIETEHAALKGDIPRKQAGCPEPRTVGQMLKDVHILHLLSCWCGRC